MTTSSCVPGMAHASAERMDGGWQEEHDALSLKVFIFTYNREGQTPPDPLTLVKLTRQHLLGMEQRASSKIHGRVRDQLDRFQNKTISATEAGFSSQFSHMLKFLSPSSLAAAVQGTRSTEQQAVHLLTFDKKQMRSCEPTNHNPSVIKHLEKSVTCRHEEASSPACSGYCSDLAFPTATVMPSKFPVEWYIPQRLSTPFWSSLSTCNAGISFHWPHLPLCNTLLQSS